MSYHKSCSHIASVIFKTYLTAYWAFYQIAKSREKGGRQEKKKEGDQSNKLSVLCFQVINHQAKKLEILKTKMPRQMEYSKAH